MIGRRPRPLSAPQIREMLELPDGKQIVLLALFGHDDYLERLWNERDRISELAGGGFALIVAPSYSAWLPRPRPEYFWASKRSLVIFEALQRLGAPAIPRLTWTIPHDAERCARWANANPAISHVGLDLTTYGDRGYASSWSFWGSLTRRPDGVCATSSTGRRALSGPTACSR